MIRIPFLIFYIVSDAFESGVIRGPNYYVGMNFQIFIKNQKSGSAIVEFTVF